MRVTVVTVVFSLLFTTVMVVQVEQSVRYVCVCVCVCVCVSVCLDNDVCSR